MYAITPTNDIEEHEDYKTTCKCNPKIEFLEGEIIIIHNAFDQREVIEKVEEILNKNTELN